MVDTGIVMPVYKQVPRYLTQALKTILNQKFRKFRLIVVLDGAPGTVEQIVRRMTRADPRVTILKNRQNQGVAASLNRGVSQLMKMPDIRYLTWVSSDNIHFPHFIGTLRNALKKAPPKVGLVYSNFLYMNENDKPIPSLNRPGRIDRSDKSELLNTCIIGASFMYKKSYAQKIRGYYMEPVEDYDYWLRLTEVCDFEYVPKTLMKYRLVSRHSISSKLDHRHFRYMFELAKWQARQRRNIPEEIDIHFIAESASPKLINELEQILDQKYSNFLLHLTDVTPSGEALRMIQSTLRDPRIRPEHRSGSTLKQILEQKLPDSRAPFTLIHRHPVHLPVRINLKFMLKWLRSFPAAEAAEMSAGKVRSVMIDRFPVQSHPLPDRLYRTKTLKKLLSSGQKQ